MMPLGVVHERPPRTIECAIGVAETLERGRDYGARAHCEQHFGGAGRRRMAELRERVSHEVAHPRAVAVDDDAGLVLRIAEFACGVDEL